jgi:hypothetical protein
VRLLVLTLAVWFLIGCAAKESSSPKSDRPEWVAGNTTGYPDSRYLIGLGSGPSAMMAADRARGDLIKVLSVQVSSQSSAQQRTWGGAQLEGFEQNFENTVQTQAQAQLEGVAIAERYRDPQSQQHHALAVLDRAQALGRLDRQMQTLKESIAAAHDRARTERDSWVRLRTFYRGLEKLSQFDALAMMRSVIDPAGAPPQAHPLSRDMTEAYHQSIRSIALALRGDASAQDLLSGALDRAGFVLQSEASALFYFDVALEKQVQQREGWYWADLVLQADLVEREEEAQRGSLRFFARESATDKATALRRAKTALEEKLHQSFLEELVRVAH